MQMKTLFGLKLAALVAVVLLGIFTDSAQAGTATSLLLDFQPTSGTTEAGYEAFVETNQLPSLTAMNYSAFGTTVGVKVLPANLPDGNLDFRAVARNGALGEKENDWIGVDTRNGGIDVILSVIVSNLPAGQYSWLSTHHDGGSGATNGNLNGLSDYQFVDANGDSGVVANGITFSSQNDGDPISTFGRAFQSDGSDVTFSMIMDFEQGGSSAALFAFINSVELNLIPEPTSLTLFGFGLMGMVATRRRHK